jgi:secondary thiamine-phosphate synthase enzyme
MINHYHITLEPFSRGFHLVTKAILEQIDLPKNGLLHVFIKHTSAALTVNENADASVRADFESTLNIMVPENSPHYTHSFEGLDDMPAHIKSSLMGSTVSIPIVNHQLDLGTWQGIYLCEFRNNGGKRKLTVTGMGNV